MDNVELAIKYTDEVYATKAEVCAALHTNLIEPFWLKITEYRNKQKRVLSLLAISKSPYYITMTEPVRQSLTDVQNKLAQLAVKVARLSDDALEKITVRSDMYTRILKAVAQSNNLVASDVTIANVISGRPVQDEYKVLVDYFSTLKYLEGNYTIPVSQDVLAEFLAKMQGVDELTSFYRASDINTREQKAMVAREYTSAPVSMIEYLLDNTIDFINHSSFDYIVKSLAAFYSINSIKPFEAFNEELANIIAKRILAPASVERLVSLIPLEEVLNERPEVLTKCFTETNRTRDLTYLLIEYLKRLNKAISIFSTRLEQIQLTNVRKEFVQGENEEEFAKEIGKTYVKETPATNNKVEEKPVKKVQPQSQPAYNPTPVVHVAPAQHVASKDYDALAEDLLESDPFLRPAQAAFYVRHCTVGKFYTIAQYQKATGCVYETARTSMDNLAKRGYYKREGLKNKFIYTPIPKE